MEYLVSISCIVLLKVPIYHMNKSFIFVERRFK